MSIIRKRLHVSGLTPAITVTDINARLNGFGTVLALDGFGTLDALGQPKKFAYVTLEATESNLARCVNVLSGTTWKGAKLRIGDAKPDYAERLETERKQAAAAEEERPSKRRRLPRGVHGVHADDMATVDLQNVDAHPGWQKTTLSHLIRPMKMRPTHPLPELHIKQKDDVPKKSRKKKPKAFDGPTRARVRTIDPRLYDPVHLRENMLEAVVIDAQATKPQHRRSPSLPPSSSDEEEAPPSPILDAIPPPGSPPGSERDVDVAMPDLVGEKTRDLGLLMTMFGDDASDWGGKESIDEEDLGRAGRAMEEPEVESEVEEAVQLASTSPEPAAPATSQVKSLKDMFKPHEEEAGFSFLAGLGDLELDIDPAFDLDAPAPVSVLPTPPVQVPSRLQPVAPAFVPGLTLDPSLPLFFPQPDNPRAKDVFSMAREEGWEFGRSGDAEFIRRRWEETKGPLTREWKKRAREAVKARRRRYGAAEGEEA